MNIATCLARHIIIEFGTMFTIGHGLAISDFIFITLQLKYVCKVSICVWLVCYFERESLIKRSTNMVIHNMTTIFPKSRHINGTTVYGPF